jgi:hypothetical protein
LATIAIVFTRNIGAMIKGCSKWSMSVRRVRMELKVEEERLSQRLGTYANCTWRKHAGEGKVIALKQARLWTVRVLTAPNYPPKIKDNIKK